MWLDLLSFVLSELVRGKWLLLKLHLLLATVLAVMNSMSGFCFCLDSDDGFKPLSASFFFRNYFGQSGSGITCNWTWIFCFGVKMLHFFGIVFLCKPFICYFRSCFASGRYSFFRIFHIWISLLLNCFWKCVFWC